jgi:hypothetical protein
VSVWLAEVASGSRVEACFQRSYMQPPLDSCAASRSYFEVDKETTHNVRSAERDRS